MVSFIRRIVLVLVGTLAVMVLLQRVLSRDAGLKPRLVLEVTQTDGNGHRSRWQFTVGHYWDLRIGSSPATVGNVLERLGSAVGELSLTATDGNGAAWTASRDAQRRFTLEGQPASIADLRLRLLAASTPGSGFRPTRPALIQEVLEANLPMPTRSKVSFPEFSYQDAFPEANDSPEIVIQAFDEAPMLRYVRGEGLATDLPPHLVNEWVADWNRWRKHYPSGLPAVEQRLPRNPAVVMGPDGLGQYGGTWRRCTYQIWDLTRKVCTESFTRHDPAGRIQPCLAYKWDVSEDNRVFTFYLRKGHRWSDGVPYTTADILWACNTLIGSESIPDPPDWMQATDGSMTLYGDDVSDWSELARMILRQADSNRPSVGGQIKALAEERLWRNLQEAAAGPVDPDRAILLAADLNELFRDARFYTPEAFADVDLGAEQRELEAEGASRLDRDRLDHLLLLLERGDVRARFLRDPNSLEPIELNRMNLLLFRTAYRGLVLPPLKRRVKVEAIPDEHGDDTHIVRFTFRKPNSLFLEQTTTFMFYRILATAKHASAPMHPYGSDVLATTDIWRWEGFWTRVAAEARGEGPSPGKRLWERLGEAARKKVEAGLPPRASGEDEWDYDERTEPYRAQVVQAVNEAMSSPGFHDADAWKGFDLEAWKRIVDGGEGFTLLSRDQARLDEYRDLLVLEDLLKRWQQGGPASLAPGDHLKLNVLMFRWAYSRDEKPLVGRTRGEGLNRLAERHPRKYPSWQAMDRDRGNYHPKYNPHLPVLFAWRIVEEKDKPEILAVRNPYYYRVDAQGRQLPYIDAVLTSISRDRQVRLLKMRSGNVDFQAREIIFEDFTPLKQHEKEGDYQVLLWAHDYCGEVTFCPIQAHKDPMIRQLNEDPNFRYALSLALNRQEIIEVAFAGMGRPAQFSVPEGSPFYSREMAQAFIEYDPDRANRLLDAMGLDQRAADGTRLLWDGRPLIMDVNVVSGGEVPLQVVTLACVYWQAIGINAQMKFRTNAMMYRLESLGESDMRVHKEGGNFYGPMPPGAYYPSHPAESVQWYQWASFMRTAGRQGKPAPERIKELERMWQKMVESPTEKEKLEHWRAITDRFVRDLPIIGVMTSPGKVAICKNNFRNVPRLALAGWIAHEPGNCCPECFFFDHYYVKK